MSLNKEVIPVAPVRKMGVLATIVVFFLLIVFSTFAIASDGTYEIGSDGNPDNSGREVVRAVFLLRIAWSALMHGERYSTGRKRRHRWELMTLFVAQRQRIHGACRMHIHCTIQAHTTRMNTSVLATIATPPLPLRLIAIRPWPASCDIHARRSFTALIISSDLLN